MKQKLLCILFCLLPLLALAQSTSKPRVEEIAPGVFTVQIGQLDRYTPYSLFGGMPELETMKCLPTAQLPFNMEDIGLLVTERGCVVDIPLQDGEQLYGFGLQIDSYTQRGLRKQPKVNDNPLNSLGYTHAPQTFYVSTLGYGILVNTARYTTFLCGSNQKQNRQNVEVKKYISDTTDDLYKNRNNGSRVYVDIPGAKGIEVFIISGPQMLDVVKRYNLLSGGGCLPPMWGLGFKYRVKGDAVQDSVMRFANYFREKKIPCDVLGLEPGWQTAAYSCSYVWSKDRFPNHKSMLSQLNGLGYRVNLWEHAYVHPSSPIHDILRPYAGDFTVWGGLVPDFILPESFKIFTDYHRTLVDEGVSGFKLDECDNSNIAYASATWCFPDMSQFPSGLDGEQMHQVFGSLYLNAMDSIFRAKNMRTYQDYRSSGMFMSSRGAVLYSDTYNHKQYVQMICNAAFGGLLWCPEVRESHSVEELFHRLQTTILSPQAMVNAWYLQYPPWLQFDRGLNEQGKLMPEAAMYEDFARTLINYRMQLLPYLYTAFYRYCSEGIPPFRPLIMDYPTDKRLLSVSDQYMIGSDLMAAPLFENKNSRKIYFPEGIWYNFNTNEKYEGGREYEIVVELNQLPLFVREGTLLPLADPVLHVSKDTSFNLHCKVYGTLFAETFLFEDDGESYDFTKGEFNRVLLKAEKGKVKMKRVNNEFKQKRYFLKSFEFVGTIKISESLLRDDELYNY